MGMSIQSKELWEKELAEKAKQEHSIDFSRWRTEVSATISRRRPLSVSINEFWLLELKAVRPDIAEKVVMKDSVNPMKLKVTNRFWQYVRDSW